MNEVPRIEFGDATRRQQATWSTGDFHVISRGIVGIGEALVEAADPRAGERVLDVACGSGNCALSAAKRYCDVTGIDYVPDLIARASRRADAEGLDIDFDVGDAQALPYADDSFDVAVSVFGVMFAPDQEKAAAELLRVVKPGGRIALANWMPDGFGSDFFGVHFKYNPPAKGSPSPLRWGTENGLRDLFGDGVTSIRSEHVHHRAYMHSAEHAVDLFSRYFGPTSVALAANSAAARESLRAELKQVFEHYNRATDGTLVAEMDYCRTIMVRT